MGIKWNPDFNKKEHKKEASANAQEIFQKAGAKKWVAPVKRRVTRVANGKSLWQQKREREVVKRDFVGPGSLVKLVGRTRKNYGAPYCTVVSEVEHYSWGETVGCGKWWECILPDGASAQLNSADMRPIDVQNGNLPTMEDDEEG